MSVSVITCFFGELLARADRVRGGKQCAFFLWEPQVSLVPQLLLNYWERVMRSSASLDQTNRRQRWRPRVPGYIGVYWTTSTACAREQRRQRVLSTWLPARLRR